MTNLELIVEQQQKQYDKGYIPYHDSRVNNKGQLTQVASLLSMSNNEEIYEDMIKEFSTENNIVENWDNKVVLKYLNLPYKERIILAASLLLAEANRIDYTNKNNINGNV